MAGQKIVTISIREADGVLFEKAQDRARIQGLSFSRYVIGLIRKDFSESPASIPTSVPDANSSHPHDVIGEHASKARSGSERRRIMDNFLNSIKKE